LAYYSTTISRFLGTTAGLFGEFYSTSPHPLTTLYSSQVIYKEPYFHID